MVNKHFDMSVRNPFFSVVTISFNQFQYLPACLDSIHQQCFKSLEHIIVDPGSSDGSRDIILSSDYTLHAILEPDKGPADGLNTGFHHAKGEYILFINSDDYLLPYSLQKAYSLLSHYGYPDLLFLGGYKVFENGQPPLRIFPGSTNGLIHALGLSHFFQQGVLIKRSFFLKAGNINADNFTCWDGELFLRLLADQPHTVQRNSQPLAVFRIHDASITGSQRMHEQYLFDQQSSVLSYYGGRIANLRRLINNFPQPLRIFLKYSMDPWLLLHQSFYSLRLIRAQ